MRQTHREGPAESPSLREPLHQGQAGRVEAVTPSRRWRLASLVYATAAGAYLLDRMTKILAEDLLPARPVKLIPGVLQLTYTTNRGGAFGLFGNAPYLFLGATLVVCAAIVVASFSTSYRILAVGWGMVLGGALGNLTDR